MKKYGVIILGLIFGLFSVSYTYALTFGSIINVFQNTKTGEYKRLYIGLPSNGSDNLMQDKLLQYGRGNYVDQVFFENRKGVCYISDLDSVIKKGNCDHIDIENIRPFTIYDLPFKDKSIIFLQVLFQFVCHLFYGFPLNFFVFFALLYPIFGIQSMIKKYIVLTFISTSILNLILIYFGLSLIQLQGDLFGSLIYGITVLPVKVILAIIGGYFFYKYRKRKKLALG